MNRLHVRTSSALLALTTAFSPLAAAARPPNVSSALWFMGSRLIFAQSRPLAGDLSVSINDPGFAHFLAKLGATLQYQAGQHYLAITTADRRILTFTVGDSRYQVDGTQLEAPFAVTAVGDDVYVPFFTVARALNVDPVQDGNETVMQPQIAGLETEIDHGRTIVIVHGAGDLRPQVVSGTASVTTLRFHGTASTLAPVRDIDTPALSRIVINVSGSAKNPTTTMTLSAASGSRVGLLPAPDEASAVIAVAPQGTAFRPAGAAQWQSAQTPEADRPAPAKHASSTPHVVPGAQSAAAFLPGPPGGASAASAAALPAASEPQETAASAGAPSTATAKAVGPQSMPPVPAVNPNVPIVVNALTESPTQQGYIVKIAVSGAPSYGWRLLGDGRFYVDIHGASLATSERDQTIADPRVASLRLRANGTPMMPNVRLAMSLYADPSVSITTDAQSLTVTVSGRRLADAPRAGAGRVGLASIAEAAPQQAPNENPYAAPVPAGPWKFGGPNPLHSAMNSRLIVIDPGHGGSDTGAEHNGLTEKILTLDIAKRLRDLLVARGWEVKMTRDTDVDVYAPNDSAKQELQARCDVANSAGARLFVSVHINSFTSSDLNGTTTYYYKPQDAGFASTVEQRLVTVLGTQNDGARHENYYVIRHTTMPAILVETAFLSNPDDAEKLRQPVFRQNVAQAITDGIMQYTGGASTVPPLPVSDAKPTYVKPPHNIVSDGTTTTHTPEDDLSQ